MFVIYDYYNYKVEGFHMSFILYKDKSLCKSGAKRKALRTQDMSHWRRLPVCSQCHIEMNNNRYIPRSSQTDMDRLM